MSFADPAANVAARPVNFGRPITSFTHGVGKLSVMVPAALTAQQRIGKVEVELCVYEPQRDSPDSCMDRVGPTAPRSIRARTVTVSLLDPTLGAPARVRSGADRWQAAARLICQEMQDAGGIGSTSPYSTSVQTAFRDVLRGALR